MISGVADKHPRYQAHQAVGRLVTPEPFHLRTEAPFDVPDIVVGLHLVPSTRRGPERLGAPQFHARAHAGVCSYDEQVGRAPGADGRGSP